MNCENTFAFLMCPKRHFSHRKGRYCLILAVITVEVKKIQMASTIPRFANERLGFLISKIG